MASETPQQTITRLRRTLKASRYENKCLRDTIRKLQQGIYQAKKGLQTISYDQDFDYDGGRMDEKRDNWEQE